LEPQRMPEEKERKFAKDFLEKWARAEKEEGSAEDALKQVDEALKENPYDPALWFRRASLLTDLERWEEALEAFRGVESLDPAFPRLYVGLAFVLNRMGRVEEAAEEQKKALAAEAGEPSPQEQELEAELDRLVQELPEDLTEDVPAERPPPPEDEMMKGLEELGALAGKPGVPDREDFDALLAKWEGDGFGPWGWQR